MTTPSLGFWTLLDAGSRPPARDLKLISTVVFTGSDDEHMDVLFGGGTPLSTLDAFPEYRMV